MFSLARQKSLIFPRLVAVGSPPEKERLFVPALGSGACFPALGSGCLFPALGSGCMSLYALQRLHVFPRSVAVPCFPRLAPVVQFLPRVLIDSKPFLWFWYHDNQTALIDAMPKKVIFRNLESFYSNRIMFTTSVGIRFDEATIDSPPYYNLLHIIYSNVMLITKRGCLEHFICVSLMRFSFIVDRWELRIRALVGSHLYW